MAEPTPRRTKVLPPTPPGPVPGFGPAEPVTQFFGLGDFSNLVQHGTTKALKTVAEDAENPHVQLLGSGLLTAGSVAPPAIGLPGLTLGGAIKGMGLAAPAILGAIKAQERLGAPYFYSRLDKALEKMPQHAITPQHAEKYLKGSVNPQEMEARGVTGMLRQLAQDPSGRVKAEDLRATSMLNPIDVQQHAYGVQPEIPANVDALRAAYTTAEEEFNRVNRALGEANDTLAGTRHAMDEYAGNYPLSLGLPADATQPYIWVDDAGMWRAEWGSRERPWVMQEGELSQQFPEPFQNLVNTFMQHRNRVSELASENDHAYAAMERAGAAAPWEGAFDAKMPKYDSYATEGGKNYREFVLAMPQNGDLYFDRGHFGVPNEFVHIRAQDFQAPDGKRVLLIDEIQSDWNEEVRKHGVRGGSAEAQQLAARQAWTQAKATREEAVTQSQLMHQRGQTPSFEHEREVIRAYQAETDAYEAMLKAQAKFADAAPDMPFKNMEWAKVAMKRMLAEAAEEGFDRIAWTTGAQQAKRYGGHESTKPIASLYDGPFVDIGNKLAKVWGGKVTTTKVAGPAENLPVFSGAPIPIERLDELVRQMRTDMHAGVTETRQIDALVQELRRGVSWETAVQQELSPASASRLGLKITYDKTPKMLTVHSIDLPPQVREHIQRTGFPLLQATAATTLAGALAAQQQRPITKEQRP